MTTTVAIKSHNCIVNTMFLGSYCDGQNFDFCTKLFDNYLSSVSVNICQTPNFHPNKKQKKYLKANLSSYSQKYYTIFCKHS